MTDQFSLGLLSFCLGIGFFAAFFHALTLREEPDRFRLWPANLREWSGYFLRICLLFLVVILYFSRELAPGWRALLPGLVFVAVILAIQTRFRRNPFRWRLAEWILLLIGLALGICFSVFGPVWQRLIEEWTSFN